ncbi:MAG: ABC transporter permease [Candidatus Sulfopaludibacter sp.]|nr:ABC transporter permease [Candidatus Sulfopaludibacter sp.]
MHQDMLYALRAMRQNAAFTVTAVLTLALGIGANTAIFTVIRAVLLNPLPYRDPDRLVFLATSDPQRNLPETQFTQLRFAEMSAAAHSFAAVGAFGANMENVTLSGDSEPEPLKGARVSANFLEVLGKPPLVGRGFLPDENSAVMISAALWKRRFGGDPQIAGRTAMLDATAYTIAGVLPPGFEFPFPGVDVWFTRPSEWSALPSRYWGAALLKGFARLRTGTSLAQARAEMEVLSRQYNAAHPGIDRGIMQVVLLKDRLVQNVRPLLRILLGAVAFVLLIACANVASLLMARATSRGREFALRAALGARRVRLVRQLLAESLVLAFVGGAAGTLLAQWCLSALQAMDDRKLVGALYLPGRGDIRLDGTVLAFTLALSLVTGVLFGLFPSLQLSRPDLAGMLRETSAGAGRGLSGRRSSLGISPRGLLVVAQIALSVVLLIGAALLMRSIVRLRAVDPGFQAAGLVTMKVALPVTRYDTPRKRTAFFDALLQRVAAVPGVRNAAMAMSLPTTTWIRTNISRVEGAAAPDERDAASYAVWQSIAPGYFQTMQIPLRRGREFTARDNVAGAPPVIIVNESLARHLWRDYPTVNPVGRHIAEAYDKAVGWLEVVGVAADIREGGLASQASPEFYVPYAIHPPQTAYLAVRTGADPLPLVNSIRAQVSAVDREQAVSEVKTMEAVLETSLGNRPWALWLLGTFAGLALLLALVGIYGVIAYSVAQRTQEMGIRRALGAQHSDIVTLVLREGLGLTVAGTAIGMGGGLALTRVMKGLLFRTSPTDPATFAGIALLFILVAGAASYLPARRATRVDPASALR